MARWRSVDGGRPLRARRRDGSGRCSSCCSPAPNEVVSTDRLIDELWDGRAAARLRRTRSSTTCRSFGRRSAAGRAIETRPPGYLIRVGPDELDLLRFERLVARRSARIRRRRRRAACGEALGALARPAARRSRATSRSRRRRSARLEELRLAALERRIDADLALGRHAELVGELEALVAAAPAARAAARQLMLALYARRPAGRGARGLPDDARTARRRARDRAEPGAAGARAGDPAPGPGARARRQPRYDSGRSSWSPVARTGLDALLALAEPLPRKPTRELILARLLVDDADESAATDRAGRAAAGARRPRRRLPRGRVHAERPAAEAARARAEHDARPRPRRAAPELARRGPLDQDRLDLLERRARATSACSRAGEPARDGPVVTPFGGVEHDWAAIELAAWLALSLGTTLRLLGTEAVGRAPRREPAARARLAARPAAGRGSSPSRCSFRRARRRAVAARTTRACSWSGSPIAGVPRGSARPAPDSLRRPRCPCCLSAAACARAALRRARRQPASPGRWRRASRRCAASRRRARSGSRA